MRVVVGVLLLLLGCWDALRGECECDGGGGHEVSVGAACNRLAAGSVEVRGHRTRDGCELLFSPCLFLFLVFSPRKRKRTFETQHVIDFFVVAVHNPTSSVQNNMAGPMALALAALCLLVRFPAVPLLDVDSLSRSHPLVSPSFPTDCSSRS